MAIKIGVIGLPGKWSTEALADAVESATGFRLVIDMAAVWFDSASNSLRFGAHNLCELDGLLVKKITETYAPHTLDRLELLRVAEAAGVRVFSPATNILRLINRLSCTVTMHNHGIPMPATRVVERVDEALQAVRDFKSAVFKPLYSTKARGMLVLHAEDGEETQRKAIEAFQIEHPSMYIQQKLDLPGRDLGMVFIGGVYTCTYARVAQGDSWNTTIHSGGKYAGCEPSKELIELGKRAQEPFGMDFTTVDIAESEQGPIVFEVSAFGGFRGAQEGCDIDAADLYVAHALRELQA